jgi:virulence-associated protein VapD
MFAISFDLTVSELKQHYGDPYNRAYFEIKSLLEANNFEWIQGSTYMTKNDDLNDLVAVIMQLSKIDWFKKSVRDIRGFKVENWSNFTELVKNS